VARNWGDDIWNIIGELSIGAEHRLAITEMGFSAGMILGGIIIGLWGGFKNKNYTFAFFTMLTGIAAAGLGLLGNFWLYTLCMLLTGVFMNMRSASVMSMMQSNVDRAYMGRSMSAWVMVGTLTMQLGIMLWAPLSDIISLDWLLVGTGAFILLMGIYQFFDKTLLRAGAAQQSTEDSSKSENAEDTQ